MKKEIINGFFLFYHHMERTYFSIRPTEKKWGPRDNKDKFQTVSLNHLVQLWLKLEIPALDFLVTRAINPPLLCIRTS